MDLSTSRATCCVMGESGMRVLDNAAYTQDEGHKASRIDIPTSRLC
jgi:hypothetical protein